MGRKKTKGVIRFPEDFHIEGLIDVMQMSKVTEEDLCKATKMPKHAQLHQFINRVAAGEIHPNAKLLISLTEIGLRCHVNASRKREIHYFELRQYLIEDNVSQSALAEKVDIDKFQLNCYLNLKKFPSCDRLYAIAKALDICIFFKPGDQKRFEKIWSR